MLHVSLQSSPRGKSATLEVLKYNALSGYSGEPEVVECYRSESGARISSAAKCISRESSPGHINGNDVFCH